MSNRTRVLLIVLVAFLAYVPALFNDFVGDDLALFALSDYYHDIRNLPRIFHSDFILSYKDVDLASSAGKKDFSGFVSYRPVVAASFFLDGLLWKGRPAGLHFDNILLHAIAGVLVFYLVRRFSNLAGIAFWAAMFFVAHPVQAELVNTIGYRSDLLATLLTLATLLSYEQIRRGITLGNMLGWSAASLVFFFLAVFSKESAVVVPFLVLLFEVCFRRIALPRTLDPETVQLKKVKQWTTNGLFAVLGFYLYVYLVLFPNGNSSMLYAQSWGLGDHLGFMAKLLGHYLTALVWPPQVHLLPPLYMPLPRFLPGEVSLLAVLAALTLAAIWAWKKEKRLYVFLIGWFWLTYLPVSGAILLPNPMAYRFLYLPSVAFFAVLALGAEALGRAVDRWARSQKMGLFLKGSLVAFFVAFTMPLNLFFHDTYTSCREMVRHFPDAQRPYFHLGLINLALGNLSAAQENLGTYLQIDPHNPFVKAMDQDYYVQHHLGLALLNDPEHARSHFEEAIRLRPDYLPAYIDLAQLHFLRKDPASALAVARRVLARDRTSVPGMVLAGEACRQLGDAPSAREYLAYAMSLAPADPDVLALKKRLEGNP